MSEFERGYDFAKGQLVPLQSIDFLQDGNAGNERHTVDSLMQMVNDTNNNASAVAPDDDFVAFLNGIKFFLQASKLEQESKDRVTKQHLHILSPGSTWQCRICAQNVNDNARIKKLHMDAHFRENALVAQLEGRGSLLTNYKKGVVVIGQLETKNLNLILQQDGITTKTRKRVSARLANNQKETTCIAESVLTACRGWMMPKKQWVAMKTEKDVPFDVMKYGAWTTGKNENLWIVLFGKSIKPIPLSWRPWFVGSQYATAAITEPELFAEMEGQQQQKKLQFQRGSLMYMRALSAQTRKHLIRAQDKWDETTCSLCGEGFQVVLSGDPRDEFEDDFILLDAWDNIFAPKSSSANSTKVSSTSRFPESQMDELGNKKSTTKAKKFCDGRCGWWRNFDEQGVACALCKTVPKDHSSVLHSRCFKRLEEQRAAGKKRKET